MKVKQRCIVGTLSGRGAALMFVERVGGLAEGGEEGFVVARQLNLLRRGTHPTSGISDEVKKLDP